MKRFFKVLFFLCLLATELNAQNCNNLTITPGGVPSWYNDPTSTQGYNCGGRIGGGYGTITGGTAPYTTTTLGASIQGNTVKFIGYPSTPFQNQMSKAVTITDANGCTATNYIIVFADLNPEHYLMEWISLNPDCITPTGSINPKVSNAVPGQQAQGQGSGISLPRYYSVEGFGSTVFSRVVKPIGTPLTGLASGVYQVRAYLNQYFQETGNCIMHNQSTVTITNNCQPLAVTSSIISQAICTTKGSVKVIATGGLGNYAYTWNDAQGQTIATTATATNLAAGTYTCTVTSGNSTQNINVTVPLTPCPPLSVTSSVITNASCPAANGSAKVTPTGGNGTYTYSWNTTPIQTTQIATNLSEGTYICTVTSNGSTQTSSVTINCPQITATSAILASAICISKTGSASVTPAGGNGTYTYNWNTTPVQTTATATNLAAGQYACTITSGNSTKVITVTLPQISTNFVATIKDRVVNKINFFYDVYINNTLPPSTGYTYLWSTGATTPSIPHGINCAGCAPITTSVSVKDQYGCGSKTQIVLPGSPKPQLNTNMELKKL